LTPKAKRNWIQGAKRNTKFFHKGANSKRKHNVIHDIKVDEELHIGSSSIQDAIVHFYVDPYSKDHQSQPFLKGIVYDSIGLDDALELEKDFSKEEVWEAINDSGKYKAPRRRSLQHCFLPTLLEFGDGGNYGNVCRGLISTGMEFLRKFRMPLLLAWFENWYGI